MGQPPVQVMLVRHGETEANLSGKLQGRIDVPLSATGYERTVELRPHVSAFQPDLVLSSPLSRATSSVAALDLALDRTDERLSQGSLGEWEGRDADELRAAFPDEYRAWRDGNHTPPGGESLADFEARVVEVLIELADGDADRIVVVTHGGVIRAALAGLVGITAEQLAEHRHSAFSIIERKAGRWRLVEFNVRPVSEEGGE